MSKKWKFNCRNDSLNQIYLNIKWAFYGILSWENIGIRIEKEFGLIRLQKLEHCTVVQSTLFPMHWIELWIMRHTSKAWYVICSHFPIRSVLVPCETGFVCFSSPQAFGRCMKWNALQFRHITILTFKCNSRWQQSILLALRFTNIRYHCRCVLLVL